MASAGIMRDLLEAIGLEASDRRELNPHVARALVLLDEQIRDLPGSAELARLLELWSEGVRHLFAREIESSAGAIDYGCDQRRLSKRPAEARR